MRNGYFFISDIHLGLLSPEKERVREKIIISFLRQHSHEMKELIILGDLFDYWFEYRRVHQKSCFRLLAALAELAESGTVIRYIIGNHDFMHFNLFEKEIGALLYMDNLSLEIEGKKFFLGHGDDFVENDSGYKLLKKILRSKNLQAAYRLIHPDLGIFLASGTSKSSREYTTAKEYGETDGLRHEAERRIDAGYDFVLFGHTHKREMYHYKHGLYVNLGTWLEKPCYGLFQDGIFHFLELTIDDSTNKKG